MLKELDAVKKLLEIEYETYHEELYYMERHLQEQEKTIREQERFLVVLEQEREKKSDFLSAYNNEDTLSDRISEENERKQQIEKDCVRIRGELDSLSEKTENYKYAIEQLTAINQEDCMIVNAGLMDEIDDALKNIVAGYTKGLKELTKVVEEYIYMDPERVKVEMQKYIKENKDFINQVKSIRKSFPRNEKK